jgi:hypothetical protein
MITSVYVVILVYVVTSVYIVTLVYIAITSDSIDIGLY